MNLCSSESVSEGDGIDFRSRSLAKTSTPRGAWHRYQPSEVGQFWLLRVRSRCPLRTGTIAS